MKLSYDIDHTLAILIGTGSYENYDFIPIEPVKGNLEDLKNLLLDKDIFGLSEQSVIVLENKTHIEILEALSDALSDKNLKTIFIYYSGHGHRTAKDRLYLTAYNSKKAFHLIKATGIEFSDFKNIIENSPGKPNSIIILDACYSGIAAQSDSTLTEEEKSINGSYIITSSSNKEQSFFDANARHTFFTDSLIEILSSGSEDSNMLLSINDVYNSLQSKLRINHISEPQKRDNLDTEVFYFAKNKKFNKVFFHNKAEENFKSGNYSRSLEYFITLQEKFFDNSYSRQIERCKKEIAYSSLIINADSLYNNKKYEQAVVKYHEAKKIKSDSTLLFKISQCLNYIRIKKELLEEQQQEIEEKRLREQEELKKKQEEELKRKQDEELKRKQDEELKRKQDEELKRKQEEELKRKQEEELKRKQDEDLKRKQDEELKRKQEEELKRKQEEELKRKQEEELKRKQEEELKRKQNEELKRKQDEELKRKQDEELKRKQDEELKRKQDVELKRKQDEELKRKQEEELKRKQDEELKRKQEEELIKRDNEDLKNKQEVDLKLVSNQTNTGINLESIPGNTTIDIVTDSTQNNIRNINQSSINKYFKNIIVNHKSLKYYISAVSVAVIVLFLYFQSYNNNVKNITVVTQSEESFRDINMDARNIAGYLFNGEALANGVNINFENFIYTDDKFVEDKMDEAALKRTISGYNLTFIDFEGDVSKINENNFVKIKMKNRENDNFIYSLLFSQENNMIVIKELKLLSGSFMQNEEKEKNKTKEGGIEATQNLKKYKKPVIHKKYVSNNNNYGTQSSEPVKKDKKNLLKESK